MMFAFRSRLSCMMQFIGCGVFVISSVIANAQDQQNNIPNPFDQLVPEAKGQPDAKLQTPTPSATPLATPANPAPMNTPAAPSPTPMIPAITPPAATPAIPEIAPLTPEEKKPADPIKTAPSPQPITPPELSGAMGTPSAPLPGTADSDAVIKELQEIRKLIEDEKYKEAEAKLTEAIQKRPDDIVALIFLGTVYRLENKLDEAIETFGKSIEIAPDLGEAYLRRGVVWYHKKEYVIAANDFEEASGFLFDARPEFWRGMCLIELNQPRKAISAFSASLKSQANYVPARINRGLTYMSLGETESAVQDFNEAIRLSPKDPGLFFKRGVAYSALNNYERAIASYNEALRLKPDYKEAKENREAILKIERK